MTPAERVALAVVGTLLICLAVGLSCMFFSW